MLLILDKTSMFWYHGCTNTKECVMEILEKTKSVWPRTVRCGDGAMHGCGSTLRVDFKDVAPVLSAPYSTTECGHVQDYLGFKFTCPCCNVQNTVRF